MKTLTWKGQSASEWFWRASAALEKTCLAFSPSNRTDPTTSARINMSRTAYSAMSWPSSLDQLSFCCGIYAGPEFPGYFAIFAPAAVCAGARKNSVFELMRSECRTSVLQLRTRLFGCYGSVRYSLFAVSSRAKICCSKSVSVPPPYPICFHRQTPSGSKIQFCGIAKPSNRFTAVE